MESKRKITPLILLREYWFVPVAAAIIACIIISGFRIVFVVGESMSPTLENEDALVLDTHNKSPERYDVIVFRDDEEGVLIKRVIGLPGESVRMQDGIIYIDGKPISDPVGVVTREYGILADDGIKLGEDEYFCMGDNRNNSLDCRVLGPAKQSTIMGVCVRRFPTLEKID